MDRPVYRRVLIKISGEALAGEKKTGFDFDFVTQVCRAVKSAVADQRSAQLCDSFRHLFWIPRLCVMSHFPEVSQGRLRGVRREQAMADHLVIQRGTELPEPAGVTVRSGSKPSSEEPQMNFCWSRLIRSVRFPACSGE